MLKKKIKDYEKYYDEEKRREYFSFLMQNNSIVSINKLKLIQ
jgi:hypothetical protein